VLSIDAGAAYANYTYLIAGTSSGVFPGTLQDGLRVPLNFDDYTKTMLEGLGRPAYHNFRGRLDKAGRAQAKLVLPGTRTPGLIGTVYHHAAVLIDPKDKHIVATTNPVELLLLP
jgi:hypothetical protein